MSGAPPRRIIRRRQQQAADEAGTGEERAPPPRPHGRVDPTVGTTPEAPAHVHAAASTSRPAEPHKPQPSSTTSHTAKERTTASAARSSTAAAVAADAPPRIAVDRSAFSSVSFAAPTFVNNIFNRILFPILLKNRQEQKRRGGGAAGGNSASPKLFASDGSALFSSHHILASARQRDASGEPETDFQDVASQLSLALEHASHEISTLLREEEALLQRQEVRCKRVEIKEKRQLATIRLGLEATSARLQEYENRVSNAKTTTAGIEQHLAQSNARVQRGKSVSQLLRLFKMLTTIKSADLSGMLKVLSKARALQRKAVTDKWSSGRVSAFNPRYYTTATTEAAGVVDADGGGGARATATAPAPASGNQLAGTNNNNNSGHPDAAGRSTVSPPTSSPNPTRIKTKAVFRTDRSSSRRASVSSRAAVGGDMGASTAAVAVSTVSPARSDEPPPPPLEEEEPSSEEDSDGSEDSVDGDGVHVMNVKLHRAEAAAVSAGLDRMFAARSYTEAQVEWCQKLLLLSNELGGLASNTKNVEAYANWLRQELVSDLFHVIARFNEFYDHSPQTAAHTTFGKALLKTMELISRLYTTITPTTDALMTVFFARSVNDLGVALFSEYSPRPLPNQPPLPESTPLLAMEHFTKAVDGDLRKAFAFLVEQVKRDVTVVETILGTTSNARQQLLSQATEGVAKRFIEQQIKLAETYMNSMIQSEALLSPRSKRRCGLRVADAIAYCHTMEVRLFSLLQNYIEELKKSFDASEVEFLNRFTEQIFVNRVKYSEDRAEMDLLARYHTLIEEKYTRSLHPMPDECYDLREAHMTKSKEMMDRLTEVTTRIKTYALPNKVGPYIFDVVHASLKKVGSYLDEELRKTLDSVRADRDNWKLRPKSEEELLKPSKPESQQSGFRMLLFAQSTLMSLNDSIAVICMPVLQVHPRLIQDIDDARSTTLESLDDRAESLLNVCAQAIIVRSLAILLHYQNKNDYLPRELGQAAGREDDAVAPPCTRACTLFCYYVTRQFEEAKEFIRLSNGQIPQRQTASQMAGGAAGSGKASAFALVMDARTATPYAGVQAVRARARTMNLQQLLYGDGGPSSFVRTIGVCLYRGISAHLKGFTANDRGALVYKQDVTAYKEAVAPLTSTAGLGGAVVETLFQMLKETSSLLIMPLDHIKEVKESGTLKLMSNEEKIRYIKIREDVRDAFKEINR